MAQTSVAQFADSLKMPAVVLLEQLQKAGVVKTKTDDLLTEATGRPLDASVFKAHLRRRYIDEV